MEREKREKIINQENVKRKSFFISSSKILIIIEMSQFQRVY